MSPPIGSGTKRVFPVHADFNSDGEGQNLQTFYIALVGNKLVEALRIEEEPSSGSGYPHTNETVTQRALGSTTNGYPDIAETRDAENCEDPDTCTRTQGRHVWRFDGTKYAMSISGDKLIKGATASSFLKEKGMPKRYYAPEQAIDGVVETAWVEGVKGPGIGEWLQLNVSPPAALASITLLGGCGVNDALWSKNHRLKKVKISLDGAADTEVTLEDARREQTFPLSAKGPVTTVKLTLVEVYKGKSFDDACISEVKLTPAK